MSKLRFIIVALLLLSQFTCSLKAAEETAEPQEQAPVEIEEFKEADVSRKGELGKYYGFSEMEIIKLDWDVANIVIDDIDGDGINDIAVINNLKSRLDILLTVKNPQEAAVKEFFTDENDDINEFSESGKFKKENVLVNVKVLNLVCGDFNGDGLKDFAFYGNPKGLYLLLQKKPTDSQDAKSLIWQNLKKIKIDDGLGFSSAIAADDINADGRNDLLVLSADAVYVLMQQTDGELANPVKFAVTEKPLGIELCDINNDGHRDILLITTDENWPVHIRFGDSTGKFGPQQRYFIDRPAALTIKKDDKDNLIYTVDLQSNRLNCYKYSPQITEKDKKIPIVYYPLEASATSTYSDIVAGDFDGDGLYDIVVSNPTSAQITLFRNTAGKGLEKGIDFPALSETLKISIANIDGDSKDELVSLSVKEKTLGISSYENERFLFPQPIDTGGEPLAFEICDANGSGRTDCAVIVKDANDARFFAVIYGINRSSGEKVSDKLYLKDVLSNPENLKALDFDGNGLCDFIVFISSYSDPIFIRQTAAGVFEILDKPSAGLSLIKSARPEGIFTDDIDGKNGNEILIAQGNFARNVIFDTNAGRWDIVDQYNAAGTANTITSAVSFDIDGDSEKEIILFDSARQVMQILKKDKDNIFRFSIEQEIGSWQLKKVMIADVGADGAGAIILFDGKKFALISPAAQQGFLEQMFSYETDVKDGKYARIAVGHLNTLGIADLVVLEYTKAYIEILAMQDAFKPQLAMRFKVFEQKSFEEEQQRQLIEPRQIEIADVTGDGKDDIIIIVHDRIIVYPQD